MCLKISAIRRPALWLFATLVPGLAVNAGSAYLPITGPTPLRFEVAPVRPLPPALPAALVGTKEKSGDTTPLATTNNFTRPVEDIPLATAETSPPPVGPVEAEVSGPAENHPPDNSMLIITPQMLAEYFRPASGATNGAGTSVFLPVSVGFTPPTEKTPPSSRATYKTE